MKPAKLCLLVLLAACSSAPPATPTSSAPVPDPEAEQTAKTQQERDKKRRDIQQVLIELDQAMASYSALLNQRGSNSADRKAEKVLTLLRERINGARTDVWHADERGYREELKRVAQDQTAGDNQGIALAALGFAEGDDVMAIILQGAQLTNPDIADRAVFGLAMLASPRTPPGVLVRIVEDEKHPEIGRVQAAWALLQLQPASERQAEILAFWQKSLQRPQQELPAGVLVSAIRGIGLTRKEEFGPLVAPFGTHPTPLVRMATAISIGRLNARAQHEVLIAMIGPAETNANVRLAASKALQALAGGEDRGYDVAKWRQAFEDKPK